MRSENHGREGDDWILIWRERERERGFEFGERVWGSSTYIYIFSIWGCLELEEHEHSCVVLSSSCSF